MANNVTAIELARSGIRMTIGYVQNGKVFVLQALQGDRIPVDSDGGISVKAAEESIALLFETARKALGRDFDFGPVIAVFPGRHFRSREGEATTLTVDKLNHIRPLDYSNCISMIQKETREDGYAAVCCAPFLFVYDNQARGDFLPGQVSEKLTVKADCLLLESNDVHRYRKIFNDLDIYPYLELVDTYAGLCFLQGTSIPEKFLFLSLCEDHVSLALVEERRLLFAKTLEDGISDFVLDFAKRGKAPLPEAWQFARLFGFVPDAEHVFSPLPHATTIDSARTELEKAFSPLLASLASLAEDLRLEQNVPLVLFGSGTEIPGIDAYLSEGCGRECYIVNNNTIGARSQDFIPCLGAIKASSLPYQLSSNEGQRQAEDEVIRKTYFGRN